MKRHGKIKSSAVKLNNVIYTGRHHIDCFVLMLQNYKISQEEVMKAEQGFLTENGFFVNREQALEIAKHFNQIKVKHPSENELYSEDYLER